MAKRKKIPIVRKFDGKIYRTSGAVFQRKTDAYKSAKRRRTRGELARVVPAQRGWAGWVVYWRKK